MNYLAHIYLSGNEDSIILGNFIADSIKGKKYLNYPLGIQKGILLHRAIDSFTDQHPIVKQSTKRLHKNYSHYSGVIVDILYDHFLAKNWSSYSDISLKEYTENFYSLLQNNYELLPPKLQAIMPKMVADNWLLTYATVDGIANILYYMNLRTKNQSKMNLAVNDLKTYYTEFESEFTDFFSELIIFSASKLKSL